MLRYSMLILIAAGCHEVAQSTPKVTKPDPPPGDDPSPYTTPSDSADSGSYCFTAIASASPADGDLGAYYRTTVHVELLDGDPTATLRVLASDGSEVPGSLTSDGLHLTWLWAEPLMPLTQYTVELTTQACGAESISWTTSNVGMEVFADLTGDTYALDIANGIWISPVGVSGLFVALLKHYRLLLQVVDVSDPETIDLRLAAALGGEQNLCAPTVDFFDIDYGNPYFELPSMPIELQTSTFQLSLTGFVLSGAFAPDGSRIQGAVLAGLLDTRNLGEALALGTEPDAVCQFVAALGVSCTPCIDGELYCLDLQVENVDAPLSAVPLEVITTDDVSANPDCAP